MSYILKTIVVGFLEVNCYILVDKGTNLACIIDPGDEAQKIIAEIDFLGVKPIYIINTHSHGDHIGANTVLTQKYNAKICIHKSEATHLLDPQKNLSASIKNPIISVPADVFLSDADTLTVGKLIIKVITTPGHTEGGISLICEDLLFSGDTLFCGTVGRTDLPGGNYDVLMDSLKKYLELPENTKILPGHGPACVLAQEKKHNQYLCQ